MNKPIIIYLDNSTDWLELVEAATINDTRFELEFVTNSDDLLNKMKNKNYAAALIDLNLGVTLSGTIIVLKIREIYPTIPIAIYTSYDESRVRCLVNKVDLEKGVAQVWEKSGMEINLLADKLANLVG